MPAKRTGQCKQEKVAAPKDTRSSLLSKGTKPAEAADTQRPSARCPPQPDPPGLRSASPAQE